MPLILAIETATKLCSVAVARDGTVLAFRDLESVKHVHAEKVNVFVAEVLDEAGLSLDELDAVAVGIGPGSYTGLRIGLSAAKGLCFALEIPIIGVSTLGTLFQQVRIHGASEGTSQATHHPMIDARRMEVFTQEFDDAGTEQGEVAPLILDHEWVAGLEGKHLVYGDGADKAAELWSGAKNIQHISGVRPCAVAMMVEAERRSLAKDFDDLAYLVPAYGKAANVAQPKKLRT